MNGTSSDSTESLENNIKTFSDDKTLDVLSAYVQQNPSLHDWQSITITRRVKSGVLYADIVIKGSSEGTETLQFYEE